MIDGLTIAALIWINEGGPLPNLALHLQGWALSQLLQPKSKP